MKYRAVCTYMCLALCCSACQIAPPVPPQSQLAIRAMQTREFQTADTKLVMKAALNALQDEGFVIKNAVPDVGLITATREIDTETPSQVFFGTLLGGDNPAWEKMQVLEATINISDFGRETRVRASFQKKVLDNRGLTISVTEVSDQTSYQNFFSKIDKSIFIQRQKI